MTISDSRKIPDSVDFDVETTEHYKLVENPETPFRGDKGQSARDLALAYLQLEPVREALDLDVPREIPDRGPDHAWASSTLSKTPWNWLPDRNIVRGDKLESIVLTLQQRVLTDKHGLDLWGCGLAIHLHHSESGELGVTGAVATALPKPELPSSLVDRAEELLGGKEAEREARNLVFDLLRADRDKAYLHDLRPVAFSVDDDLRIGLSTFAEGVGGSRTPGTQHVIVDWNTGEVFSRAPLASAVASGQVFAFDPVTVGGDLAVKPFRKALQLDAFETTGKLHGLGKVAGKYHLKGPFVEIADPNPLDINPPISTSKFDFSSRSNEFAGVNAYYHCDAMMRMVRDFGFPLGQYFQTVQLPITVVHRAKLPTGRASHDGVGINAFVIPEGGPSNWRVNMLFGLADYSDFHEAPMGLAADPRWIWHEFCHVLLLAQTDKTEFGFAHSAGDALAAIMSDPDSRLDPRAAYFRGATFPFAGDPIRRHDRCVTCGWGWRGRLYDRPAPTYSVSDPAGYRAEQILSSTLFRLYQAIGGKHVQVDRRWSAAHYVAYLIVRGIYNLSPFSVLPTNDAAIFAKALRHADADTGQFVFSSSEYGGATHQTKRVGGAVRKVIRWAFERQGLYHQGPPGDGPLDQPGEPRRVDIFLNDRADRQGGYEPTLDWEASDDALWVRHAPDNGVAPESPRAGQKNYVYINIRNRGRDAALAPIVSVDVLAARGANIKRWLQPASGQWTALPGVTGGVMNAAVPSGSTVRFGPFVWTPPAGANALLVRASAAGDRSNADAGSPLACASGPIPVEELVPYDNNLGYRAWNVS